MPYLHQYDYVMAIGTFFALLDAYNNGASTYTTTFSNRDELGSLKGRIY